MRGGKLRFGHSEASALGNVVAMRQKREADPEYDAEQYRNNGKAKYERNVAKYEPASADAPLTLGAFNYGNYGRDNYENRKANYEPASADAPSQTYNQQQYQLAYQSKQKKADIEAYGMSKEDFIASIDIDAITTSTSATSADQSQQDLYGDGRVG